VNVSRALGPALAGIVIAAWGMAAPFWVNVLTTICVIAALIWWRSSKDERATRLPPEPMLRAISSGLRRARYNSHLRLSSPLTEAMIRAPPHLANCTA
jgi:MFS family permease